jgi:hypothetical protein
MKEAPKDVPEKAERVVEEENRVRRLKEREAAGTTAVRRERRSWHGSTEWRVSWIGRDRLSLGGGR